jgi:glucosamine-6-phosphate deaminase
MKTKKYGDLNVKICDSTEELGKIAALDFAKNISDELRSKPELGIILATGNSQLPFINALRNISEIDWSKISVFHMDEYIGMPKSHSASFVRWMEEKVVSVFHPKNFFGIHGDASDIEKEVQLYSELLEKFNPSICVMGIGVNGHIAFNDPPADFETKKLVKIIELKDQVCRMQQVNEGHFPSIESVPETAVTLTVHALLKPKKVMVLTPELRKAAAVKEALEGEITPNCPASILRKAEHASLYLDLDSSSNLSNN